MHLEQPKNSNYCATVVVIKTLVPIANCDNVVHAIIMGNKVIVSKDVKVGDKGLYFPVETQLSKEYLAANNLYRKAELNSDPESKGYFDENGRVRCVKMRGNSSEGLFMPIESMSFIPEFMEYNAAERAEFDTFNGVEICRKYVVKIKKTPGKGNKSRDGKIPIESKVVENQFRFHSDTSMLYKNLHMITPDTLLSITYKMHGTSGISSNVLCKRKMKWWEKALIKLGVGIPQLVYDNLYSSRRVIKNEEILKEKTPQQNFENMSTSSKKRYVENFYKTISAEKIPEEVYREIFPLDNTDNKIYTMDYFESKLPGMKDYLLGELAEKSKGYYGTDIWGKADERLREFLEEGMTFYYEIVGYTDTGGEIQKGYTYGCKPKEFEIYIYRITYTNPKGKVFEFSARQVQDWCNERGLKPVPELFYGYASEFADERFNIDTWREQFLMHIKSKFNDKDCYMCNNGNPEEGCVIRLENTTELKAYKQKSERFYELETKNLDKGIVDIESSEE